MGKGLLQVHLDAIDTVGARVADTRREGYDKQYEYADAIKGAYEIFFFQHPSMLEYQERLKRKNERCNVQAILRVNKIPSANHITRLLDEITPEHFFAVVYRGAANGTAVRRAGPVSGVRKSEDRHAGLAVRPLRAGVGGPCNY
jgi:hypothetical protein